MKIIKLFKMINGYIKIQLRTFKYKQQWRGKNAHNFTHVHKCMPDIATVGNYTYGYIDYMHFLNKDEKIVIGNFCSIADDVLFIPGGGHYMNHLSSYPFKANFNLGQELSPTKGTIKVCDDVWIGYGATILSGVTIGQGAVVGAKSVVTKDIPPYDIYAGNRIVKYRFSKEIIKKLERFDYSQLTSQEVKDNIDLLYNEIDEKFFETEFYRTHLRNDNNE